MLEKLKDNAMLVGWVFLIVGWIIFFAETVTGPTLIPVIFFGSAVIIFVYDMIRNKL